MVSDKLFWVGEERYQKFASLTNIVFRTLRETSHNILMDAENFGPILHHVTLQVPLAESLHLRYDEK